MKKVLFISGVLFSLIAILLVGFVVSARTNPNIDPAFVQDVKDVVGNVAVGEVSTQVHEYVIGFAQKRGVKPSEVSKVKEVDFNSLPKDVNIENVGDHNLAIYEITFNGDEGTEDQIYVVTYSLEQLKAQGDLIVSQDKRNFLNFGHSGVMDSQGFLSTATGIETSLEKGYVMPRSGSITAVSTNLDVFSEGGGTIEIIVYKNGQAIGFRNEFSALSSGVKKDYDVQSKGVVNFEAGDVISVYVKSTGVVDFRDIITIVEITTFN